MRVRNFFRSFEGLKGELAVEENEEKEQNLAREARRKERRDVAAAERQVRRDEARSAMEEEGTTHKHKLCRCTPTQAAANLL